MHENLPVLIQHILTYRASQGALPTQLWDTLTIVSHCIASQALSKHPLQNSSLRHIGSLWSADPDQPLFIHCSAGGETQHQFFLPNYKYLIQLYLSLETSKGDSSSHFHRMYLKSLQDSDLVITACEWEIPQGFCTALLPISPLYSCSKGCPRGKSLPAWPKEPGWCEDLRGVVTFPLPEAHSCPAGPAAHAPLAPHAPVPVHVLRDGGFADTLPSSAPLQGNQG